MSDNGLGRCWCGGDETTGGHDHTGQVLTSYVSEALCGELRSIEVGNEHWIATCMQTPDHEGPHVGLISWSEQ